MKLRNILALIIVSSLLPCPLSTAQNRSSDDEKARVKEDIVKQEAPSFSLSLKKIMEQAEKNIQKVNDELTARKNEEKARQSFEEGNRFYRAGDLDGAKKAWQKALDVTEDPSMRDHIRKAEKEAAEKRRQQEIAERKKQRELAAQKREQERAAKKAQRQQEIAARETMRQAELVRKQKERTLEKQEHGQKTSASTAPSPTTNFAKGSSSNISDIYNEAVKLYEKKDYMGAMKKFQQVREEDPSYSRVNFYINSCGYILANEAK
jgi:tetratricopeptide (TPR) repeat protein